jgi:hypothetical protein
MNAESKSLSAVRNDRIQVGTMRAPGSRSATLDRRVFVAGPPELVQLARSGSTQHLEDLIALLKDPERSWAAQAMLAAMTRREEKIVDAYQATPDQWWDALGKTAHERWSRWYDEAKDRLSWDAAEHAFVERPLR